MFDKKKKKEAAVMSAALDVASQMQSHDCDPNGSYTGCPSNAGEKPVQDADDL